MLTRLDRLWTAVECTPMGPLLTGIAIALAIAGAAFVLSAWLDPNREQDLK